MKTSYMRAVDLPTAKALQALGYDGEYAQGYDADGEPTDAESWIAVPAPRLDDAAYWLRERYGIVVAAAYQPPFRCWNPYVCYSEEGFRGYAKSCDSHDDALEFVLKKAIKLIKDKEK